MKKLAVPLVLLLLCLAVCVSAAAAKRDGSREMKNPQSPEAGASQPAPGESPQIPDEVIGKLRRLYPDDEFGGVYLDGDTIVVNFTGSEEAARARAAGETLADGRSVEYRPVKYPLAVLEGVKDDLARYMDEYAISALDANEVTNQVDICLSRYCDGVFEEIRNLVADKYGEDIPLNFIDARGTELRFS